MFQHTHGMTRRLEQRWSLPLTYAHTGFEVGSRTDTHSTRLIWAISKLYRQTAESNAQTTPLCADTTQWYNCIKVSRAALGCLIWRRLKNLSAPSPPTRLPYLSLTASFQLLFPSAVVFFLLWRRKFLNWGDFICYALSRAWDDEEIWMEGCIVNPTPLVVSLSLLRVCILFVLCGVRVATEGTMLQKQREDWKGDDVN